MTDLAKFDPSTLTDKLRERIRNSIADLIPDDMWTALLQKEIDAFINPQPAPKQHGYQPAEKKPSTLQSVTHELLAAEAKKRIQAMFDAPEWQSLWSNGEAIASQKVTEMVRENADAIFASMISAAVQNTLNALKYNIR